MMISLRIWPVLALLCLSACGERSEIVMVPETQGTALHEVLFATNRAPDSRLFGATRSSITTYGAATVSVPPTHKTGVVEYPGKTADAQDAFGITQAETSQNPAAFDHTLAQWLAAREPGDRRAVVFVHGYNNTFSEALYMNAQIVHDYQSPDILVLFSWLSAGENLGYLQDRESLMLSRSALEALLDRLSASGVESFTIVGHSIGSQLVMEALRQHAIRNDGKQWPKLAGVVLVSPDIDVDMFEQQRKDMDALPQPFIVVGSGKDRLLPISGVINGNSLRLGLVEDAAVLGNEDATVVSASFATEMLSVNHTTAFASPAMIALLKGLEGQ
jgi:esterase/lipase superfamily enzyme